MDGELVVPSEGRLHFGALQNRVRPAAAVPSRRLPSIPAYLVVFDVLEASSGQLLHPPYHERRTVLEGLFARDVLGPPFTLCPATTDRATALDLARSGLGDVGIEGVVVKGSKQRYLPGRRAWIKVRAHTTAEGIIAGVTGRLSSPSSLLLARYDGAGRLWLLAAPLPCLRLRPGISPGASTRQTPTIRGCASYPPGGAAAATWSTRRCNLNYWRNSRATRPSMRASIGTRSASSSVRGPGGRSDSQRRRLMTSRHVMRRGRAHPSYWEAPGTGGCSVAACSVSLSVIASAAARRVLHRW